MLHDLSRLTNHWLSARGSLGQSRDSGIHSTTRFWTCTTHSISQSSNFEIKLVSNIILWHCQFVFYHLIHMYMRTFLPIVFFTGAHSESNQEPSMCSNSMATSFKLWQNLDTRAPTSTNGVVQEISWIHQNCTQLGWEFWWRQDIT